MYISLYVVVNTFIGGRQPQNKLMRLRTFKKIVETEEKINFQRIEVTPESVPLSTLKKYLIQIFSAQWREDMRQTPSVIFGCFRGFGIK